MSTIHGQPGLSSDQRSTIRSTILSTRHTLEDELRRQLEKYGIYENKRLPLEDLSHLSAKDRHTRRTLDAAIERELESTEGNLERSITNYVREATKTYLNRFVALKTIEVRGLVEETITERPEYGNRSYMHHTVAEIAGELTNASDDGFDAALDLAYQEIGAEIRMIFEESEHTAIDLDAQVREKVLDELDEIQDEAWESDEALGWVYQYFGEEEREEIDERVDEENYKIAGTDIATKTQLFTPRYIVEWLVDNSLGRLWLEMRGDRTHLNNEENCFYLTPLEDSLIDREQKPVEEITVLDPACGSGHMLFYAFDVLYQMYLEEGEVPEEYIPREILRNNLYGVDIDSGAAQIAALSLYIKAKKKSPNVTIPQLNIASADAVLINGERKQEVLERARSELEEEILEEIWDSFGNIREWGSLVLVEERIKEIIDEKKDDIEASGQAKFTGEGGFETQSTFISSRGEQESWGQVKDRLLTDIKSLASEALDRNDPIEEMFAGEVGKTVQILDLLIRDYDVVISNPPYLSSRKMESEFKKYLKENYSGNRNLYTCFIERSSTLTSEQGYSSLVTPEDFMNQYSYRKFREWMLKNNQILDAVHLSRYGFDQQKDAYTIPFVIRSEKGSEEGRTNSRFIRMTHEQEEYENFEEKIIGLSNITKDIREGNPQEDVYIINQNNFLDLPKQPFIYWFGGEILNLFSSLSSVSDIAEVMKGLNTGDDDQFIRCRWEVSEETIGEKHIPIATSDEDSIFYESPEKVVKWDGESQQQIKEHEVSSVRNSEYYDEPGVTFRKFSSVFNSRIHPKSDLFGESAYFVYTGQNHLDYALVGLLSSSVSRYIMKGLNPGMHFNVSDVESLPIIEDERIRNEAEKMSKEIIEIQKSRNQILETKREFEPENLISNYFDLNVYDQARQADIYFLHGLLDEEIYEHLEISESTKSAVHDEVPPKISEYPHITNSGNIVTASETVEANIEVKEISDSEYQDLATSISDIGSGDLLELSQTFEVSPHTVVNILKDNNYYLENPHVNPSARILSLCIGSEFGRWGSDTTDIISVSPESIRSTLDDLFSKSGQSVDSVITKIQSELGKDPYDWLLTKFFKDHHVKEYRRRGQRNPIYWQLASANDAFSCFVYYHEIDRNTLPKLRGQFLDPRINELQNELETLNAQTSVDDPDKELLKRKEDVQSDLNEIREFRDTIDEMIDDGVMVDIEKGIWENIKEWDQYEVLETGLPKLKSSYTR
jgi:type I restriction-modification system DNA methylase subunit